MSIAKRYTGMVPVDKNGQRGTNNYYARFPFRSLYGRVNTYYVYYCGNPDCLRHICKTWDKCHYCGQVIEWGNGEK